MGAKRLVIGFVLTAFVIGGCKGLTREEALVALEEAALSSQAVSVTSGTVEISTNFTLGQAVESAAAQLRDFIETQLPCADILLTDATLRIEYGVNPGNCIYNGHTFSGVHEVTISSIHNNQVTVEHEWLAISNGVMEVTGSASVTWSEGFSQRDVSHELEWTRLVDGRVGTGSGDRIQRALNGDWTEGISIEGNRQWDGESGEWVLDINDVEARWEDPVPQSGKYVLDTPFDKTAILSFSRIDADTIEVAVESGQKSFTFNVARAGTISSAD